MSQKLPSATDSITDASEAAQAQRAYTVIETVKGQRQFIVVAEVGAVADQHGAFQHVAVAERRPGVADVVRAAEHPHAMRAQERQRRHRRGAGPVAHDRDARLGQPVFEAAVESALRHGPRSSTEAMAALLAP